MPECGLKQYAELRVQSVRRNAQSEIETVEVEFFRDGGYVKAEVPFEAVELVVARASLEQTAVMWALETPRTSLIETAMNAILDSGFLMRCTVQAWDEICELQKLIARENSGH